MYFYYNTTKIYESPLFLLKFFKILLILRFKGGQKRDACDCMYLYRGEVVQYAQNAQKAIFAI